MCAKFNINFMVIALHVMPIFAFNCGCRCGRWLLRRDCNKTLGKKWRLQQDNDPKHTSRGMFTKSQAEALKIIKNFIWG